MLFELWYLHTAFETLEIDILQIITDLFLLLLIETCSFHHTSICLSETCGVLQEDVGEM